MSLVLGAFNVTLIKITSLDPLLFINLYFLEFTLLLNPCYRLITTINC